MALSGLIRAILLSTFTAARAFRKKPFRSLKNRCFLFGVFAFALVCSTDHLWELEVELVGFFHQRTRVVAVVLGQFAQENEAVTQITLEQVRLSPLEQCEGYPEEDFGVLGISQEAVQHARGNTQRKVAREHGRKPCRRVHGRHNPFGREIRSELGQMRRNQTVQYLLG